MNGLGALTKEVEEDCPVPLAIQKHNKVVPSLKEKLDPILTRHQFLNCLDIELPRPQN
jgi:hypothetical protein